MFVSYKDSSVRLTGRWDTANESYAETTTTGAYIEFAFEGRDALVCFDVDENAVPFSHLWIQLDGGDMFECPLDAYLRVSAKEDGRHVCRIIYKSSVEEFSRWYAPRHGKVSFMGVKVDKPCPIEPDDRMTIEFVGDSITEGVLIDVDYSCTGRPRYDIDQCNRPYQDDVCATYAWLTAERLGLRPIFMGYGGVGTTKGGAGRVPMACEAYPYNFDLSPITHRADVILINHGANDGYRTAERYIEGYERLLDVVRALNPTALIVSLSAFYGKYHEELGAFIAEYNAKHSCDVRFIDSFGWIPETPIHPLRDGHRTVADNLTPLLKSIIESRFS